MTPLGFLLLFLPLLVVSIRQEDRVDCQPGEAGDSNICAARGCLWDPVGLERGVPWCYLPPQYGYRADKEAEPTAQGSRLASPSMEPASLASLSRWRSRLR